MLLPQEIEQFQTTVLDYYHTNKRDLIWRHPDPDGLFNPYKIMVSEIMLQQTQAARVTEKYTQFLTVFPTINDLTEASLQDVLLVWQGLGYNRRARFLREAAIAVANNKGVFPKATEELVALPGIGINTANAIRAYAFNQPVAFIETNIRAVFIDYFFADQLDVTDRQILPLVEQTVYLDSPRDWYWALMDYGTYIKSSRANPSRRSKHHAVQSKFEGSSRQLRGTILRLLAAGPQNELALKNSIADDRFEVVIETLIKDHLVVRTSEMLQIAE